MCRRSIPHRIAVDVRNHFPSKRWVFVMSEPWDQFDDLDDSDEGAEGGKKPNPVRERMRKLEKENKELKEQNTKLSSQTRKTSVEKLLEGAKVKSPGKVAKLVPEDVEASEESVKKWLEEYSDVFSIETEEGEGEGSEQEESPEQAEQAQQMSRMNKATSKTATPTKQADIMRKLQDPNTSHEEILKMIHEDGGGFGSG